MDPSTVKIAFGILSLIPAAIAYTLYFRGMLAGKIKPHAFSWLIWGLLAGNGFIAQISAEAGIGAWATGVTSIACLAIFSIAIFHGDTKVLRLDWLLLALALISFGLLFVIEDKTLSLCITLFATLLGFSMTWRKAWRLPHEEAAWSFGLNAIKFLPAIFALQTYSFLTVAYPLTAGLANALVMVIVLLRSRSAYYEEMKYPEYARELLSMAEEDQEEARNMQRIMDAMATDVERQEYRQKIADSFHARAKRMLEILDAIGAPTFENIDKEAAETVSLFALHSYIDEMKKVLAIYEKQFKIDPSSFYKEAIPPLTDRIMIAEQRRQKFGTNWSITKAGTWFLIPVEDFDTVNDLRARYGLHPIRKPHCLSVGAEEWPLGQGPAEASDQKELTDDEYVEYTKHVFRK